MKALKYILSALVALCFAACANDDFDINKNNAEDFEGSLEVTLQMPPFSRQATRDGITDSQILTLKAYFLNESKATISGQVLEVTDGKYQLQVPRGTKYVQFAANVYTGESQEIGNGLLEDSSFPTAIPATGIPMWGSAELADLLSTNAPSVQLQRAVAKVDMSLSEEAKADGIVLGDFCLYNHALKGSLVPKDYSYSNAEPTLPSTYECCHNVGTHYVGNGGVMYTYECDSIRRYDDYSSLTLGDGEVAEKDENGKDIEAPAVIFKATYKGNTYYYKCGFMNAEGQRIPLLRNHWYTVVVKEITTNGYNTAEECAAAPITNRAICSIYDHEEDVTSISACRDYALAVNDTVYADATDVSKQIQFVIHQYYANAPFQVKVESQTPEWVTVSHTITSDDLHEVDNENSIGKRYTTSVTLTENKNGDERLGKVLITFGDLQREVVIYQYGLDVLAADAPRTVYCQNFPEYLDTDMVLYSTQLANVNGLKPEENGGRIRNDGLHFNVGWRSTEVKENGVTIKPITYYIEYDSSDQTPEYDSDKIKVTITQYINYKKYYKVTLKDYKDWNRWVSSLKIKTSDGTVYEYPIYHIGYFCRPVTVYSLSNRQENGCYHEVIDVHGYLMLDRNLGATTCDFYAPSLTSSPEGARGAYYQLIRGKKDDDSDPLQIVNPVEFDDLTIPSDEEFLDSDKIGVKAELRRLGTGESYYCVYTTGTDYAGKTREIYFPRTGYYDNGDIRHPEKTCNWTRTKLSGAQGYSSDSPDYGYWYLYLHGENSKVTISNIRAVGGYNGSNDGMYKGMPLRVYLKQR